MRKRKRWILKKGGPRIIEETNQLIGNSQFLRQSKEVMMDMKILTDFEIAMLEYAQRPTTLYIATFLKEFHDKISI